MKRPRLVAAALCSVLVLGVGATTTESAMANAMPSRTSQPGSGAFSTDSAQQLRAAVSLARMVYKGEVQTALSQYEKSIATARTSLSTSLSSATTALETTAAKSQFSAEKSAAKVVLASSQSAALAKRDSSIDEALAQYLVDNGKRDVLTALRGYQAATVMAAATLQLALDSAKQAYKADTGDERDILNAAISSATSAADQAQALRDFGRSTADERTAYRDSVRSARATYKSAISTAKSQFKSQTGTTPKRLTELPFKV